MKRVTKSRNVLHRIYDETKGDMWDSMIIAQKMNLKGSRSAVIS